MNNTSFSLKKAIASLLFRAYAFKSSMWRSAVLRIVMRIEGGEIYSNTLRQIYVSYHGISIGMYSYGGCFSIENIQSATEIGRYCSFARNVYIFRRDHPIKHKSTHPFFFNAQLNILKKDLVSKRILTIGNDVWIGMNVIILPAVSVIGDGAIIGAGSIVTRDIPPFAVVGGNPAKILKYRFNQDTIEHIKNTQWWNKNIEELKDELDNFETPLE